MPATDPQPTAAETSADESLRRALVALKDLRARAERAERAASEPIAIIGMGCRFPAGANSPAEYWDLLRAGRDAVGPVPSDRWSDIVDSADPADEAVVDQGAFIDQPVDQFDAPFFGIAPVEAQDMDPQQRLLLEVSWEALEHAGVAPDSLVGSSTGVFVGLSTFDYSHLVLRNIEPTEMGTYSGTGVAPSVAAGRISFVLGLRGPSLCLDTACSSSLVAIAMATQSLRTGACRMALAGGVNLMLDAQTMTSLNMLKVLSPSGRCHTFAADADGYVRGEGAGMIVLKRLSDAEADGDRVLAVIRAAAVNHDGRSSGLTVPSGPAQREVIERALAEAGLQPTDVDVVEAHGTGTPLGDPIEVRALDAVYGRGRSADRPLLIGSAKTNVGHLEAAAGIAGLLKIVLSLQHDELPPHLNCDELSPHIDWESMPVEVNRRLRPWTGDGRPRRAAISGFGWGGTNAHVIVEEAPAKAAADVEIDPVPVLMPLSARDDAALTTLAHGAADALKSGADAGDLAWTLQRGRARFRRRLAITVTDTESASEQLRSLDLSERSVGVAVDSASNSPRLAFVFTGQGAQLPAMGRDLYEQEPVFRAVLDECDAALTAHLPHRLLDVLYGDEQLAPLVHQTQYTQPAMFALECALAALWRSWGVTPDVVVGHSIGEYAAAVSAGVMDIATAAQMIAARGTLMGALPPGGRMQAVFADEAAVAKLIAGEALVAIAAVNGPGSVVISGDGPTLERLAAEFDAANIGHRPLEVSHAFHSPLMAPMVDEFGARIAGATLAEPSTTFVSSVTGVPEKGALTTTAYWRDQVSATVRFADAIDVVVASGVARFVEIGPQPTLLGMIARIRGDNAGLHASLRPGALGRSGRAEMLDALGELWASGLEPDWLAVNGGAGSTIDAPTYPFQRQRYWINESRRGNRQAGGHPLLGGGIRVPALGATVHEALVAVDAPDWLNDHRLAGTPVFPGAAFTEMVLSAIDRGDEIESLQIREALVLPSEGDITVQTVVTGTTTARQVQISSIDELGSAGDGKLHATAAVVRRRATPAIEPLDVAAAGSFGVPVDVTDYYARLHDVGLTYGPAFRGVTRLFRGEGTALGEIRLPANTDAQRYLLHPALLDACFHVMGAAIDQPDSDSDMFVPVLLEGVRLIQPGMTALWAMVTLHTRPEPDALSIAAAIQMFDLDGQPVAVIDRLEARRTPRSVWERTIGSLAVADHLYEVGWRLEPRPEPEADSAVGAWLVVGDHTGDGLPRALAASGAPAEMVDGFDPERIGNAVARLAASSGHQVGVVALLTPAETVVPGALHDAEQRLRPALELARGLAARADGDARLWFVTAGAQSVDGDAADLVGSMVWSLGRTVANEAPSLACVCIDLDAGEIDVDELASELLSGGSTARPADDQIAIRSRRRLVARLDRAHRGDPIRPPYGLALAGRGSLENMTYAPIDRRQPAPGEVEVEVRASGLNFRDVLNVLGMYPGDPGIPGLECAGVVTAVGDGVSELAVGDEVLGIAPKAYDSHVVTPWELMVRKPATITFAEAATLPIAFLTAAYGLSELARLRAGQSVLIHAAAGGVGMAAVSIAQRIGATVYATVGSAEKRATLEALGVHNIYSSRTLEFADQILADTEGRGVDVVLNSLADDFITRSFDVLAADGCFLEIGKRGVWTDEQAAAVRPEGRYFVYELADFLMADAADVRRQLQAIVDDIATGEARPLPLRAFSATRIQEAFRFMAQARHIGKVVLTHRPSAPRVRHDGAYLVTGGLGAIGLTVAQWLADEGAGHITLTGRSAPSIEAAAKIDELRAAGASVAVVQADVSDAASVRSLVAASAEVYPVRGVFHAAGVLDDAALAQQTWQRTETVLAPKLVAAELLDAATRHLDLDHFVLFSSVASVMGSPGQANYAAANGALDALAHRRRAAGVPAVSINWGAWGEVGMAARLDDRDRRRMADRGVRMLSNAHALEALGRVLDTESAQVAVLSIDWPTMLRQLDATPPLLADIAQAHGGTSTVGATQAAVSLAEALSAAGPEQHFGVAVEHVHVQILRVLGLATTETLDPDQDLVELGMDSLMAVELSNRLRVSAGVELASTVALEHPTINALALHLLASLGEGIELESTAIPHRDRSGPAELSFAQERMWFLDEFEDDKSGLGIRVAVAFHGDLDVEALIAALDEIYARHDVLRTVIVVGDDGPRAEKLEPGPMPLRRVDVDGDEGELAAILAGESTRTFALDHESPIHVTLVRVAADHHVMSTVVHHIAADGGSVNVFFHELRSLYEAFANGAPSPLAALPIQYEDYAAWQRSGAGTSFAKQLDYWRHQLGGELPIFEIPPDHQRPSRHAFAGGEVAVALPRELQERVADLCRQTGSTLFMVLLAGFEVVAARHAGQTDVIVGAPIAGRVRPEFEPMIGAFLNTIALRTDLGGNPTFLQLVERVRQTTLDAYANQDVPFELLLQELNPPRDLSRTPVFQLMFNMLYTDLTPESSFGRAEAKVIDIPGVPSIFDMTMYATDISGSTSLRLVYNRSLYTHGHMQRFVDQYLHVLAQVVDDPNLAIESISLVTDADADTIPDQTEVLDGTWHGSVPGSVLTAARLTPDRVAVEDGVHSWTYAEVALAMTRLAGWLKRQGVGQGHVVAIHANRSGSLVWAIAGALAVGAAYVVLDTRYPLARKAQTIGIARPSAWLALDGTVLSPEMIEALDAAGVNARIDLPGGTLDERRLTELFGEPSADEVQAIESAIVAIGPDTPACLTLTSGSTGVPKAVVGRHGSLTHFLPWMSAEFGVSSNDRFSMLSGLSHDPLQRDIFWPLWLGATIVVPDSDSMLTPGYLSAWLSNERVSVAHLTPAMGQVVTESIPEDGAGQRIESLRVALFIGDVLTRDQTERLRRLAPDVQVVNLYGTTETQRASGYHVDVPEPTPDGVRQRQVLPLGRGLPGCQLVIHNAAGARAAVGEVGDIVMRSPHLALGYLDDDELTRARFAPDPAGQSPADQLYVTGDHGRYRDDGEVEFLGRGDGQVQLRGFRIELGEVAAALRQLPQVDDAVVDLVNDEVRGPQLVGYVVASRGAHLDTFALTAALRSVLPGHMVPSDLLTIPSVPLTPNGKLDRRALPPPSYHAHGDVGVDPSDAIEAELLEIWREALGRPDIGVQHDFFAAGGHSLLATRVLAQIDRRLEVGLPISALFEQPTVVGLASVIRNDRSQGRSMLPIEHRPAEATPVLSYAQERMWFLNVFDDDTTSLGLRTAIRVRDSIEIEHLVAAFDAIFARHAVLRTLIVSGENGPVPLVLPPGRMPFEQIDVDGDDAALQSVIQRESDRTFDLAHEPPVHVTLVRITDDEHVVIVVMHHVASDGTSMGVFFRELDIFYQSFVDGVPPPLAPLAIQYDDYAWWQRHAASVTYDQQLDYWREQLAGPLPTFEIPPDHQRPPRHEFAGGKVTVEVPAALADRLGGLCRRTNATTFMVLLAGFKVVASRHAGQTDVIVGSPVAGRVRPELDPMIGAFLNTLVFRTDLGGDPTVAELVDRVRSTTLGAFDHQDVPFELLLQALNPPRDLSRTPIFQLLFNMLHIDPSEFEGLRSAHAEAVELPDPPSKFDMTMYVLDVGGQLSLRLVYNRSLFEPAHMERFVEHYLSVLDQMCTDPDRSIAELSLVTEADATVLPNDHDPLDDRWRGSVPGAVRTIAAETPDRVAVEDTSHTWTYRDLHAEAWRLAGTLRRQGVGPGALVAVYGHRSGALVPAVVGALASGALYVVLDPRYPAARLAQLVRLARPAGWLQLDAAGPIPAELAEALDEIEVGVRLNVGSSPSGASVPDPPTDDVDLAAVDAIVDSIGPDTPACLTFTSGSTGTPKAVIGRHGSLTHFLPWMTEAFGVGSGDRFSMLSGLSHDPLQRDIFWPLWLGATVVAPDPDRIADPGWVSAWLAERGITVAHLTPAMGQLVVERAAPGSVTSLRVALFIGDVLTRGQVDQLRQVAPHVRVINLYGTTETQRASGYFELTSEAPTEHLPTELFPTELFPTRQVLPLGRGMPGSQLLVRTTSDRPASVGEVGTIVVRSPHLAIGYLDDPSLTAARFRVDPGADDPAVRRYITGDLGRYRADGAVEFLGRHDDQVQLRGFRIELGEVAAAIRALDGVADAVVRLHAGDPERSSLIGYVVPSAGAVLDLVELASRLRAKLPAHMIPGDLIALDGLPLTPNGKLDWRSLPAPATERVANEDGAPRDPLERMLVEAWEEVLDRRPIGIHDDFFELGGYSLLATRLFGLIEQRTGRRLPVSALFEHPTIAGIGDALRRGGWHSEWTSLVPIQPAGAANPFFYVTPYLISVLELAALGDELGRRRPLYGIQPQGLDGRSPVHTSIEEMAAHYISEIKSVQAEGPYAIGGHCAGSWVAFEIARQLESAGDEVGAVILVDQGPPGVERPRIKLRAYLSSRLRLYYGSGRLRHAVAFKLKILTARLFLVRVGSPITRSTQHVKDVHRLAHRAYGGGRLKRDVTLILSDDSVALTDKSWYERWSEVTDGELTIRRVGGTHANLLVQPYVVDLARTIAEVVPDSDDSGRVTDS